MIADRLTYWRRILKVYLTQKKGYLSFWHERPAVGDFDPKSIGGYYMTFHDKARYGGPRDENGTILFDYFFDIGRQYNPLAIAQYGLGNFNLYLETGDQKYLEETRIQAEWLVENLEENEKGIPVWKHKFRWHYKTYLESGWYSAHSQGTGISLLARMYRETKDERYKETAIKAFRSLDILIKEGGTKFTDEEGLVWLEEYVIHPPTHILNGFLWALWGVWDFYLLSGDESSKKLFNACVKTLETKLERYDVGFWSRYDLSRQALPMIASPFYHKLHIVQLKVMHGITGKEIFERYAEKFERYERNWIKRKSAFFMKALFKIFYF